MNGVKNAVSAQPKTTVQRIYKVQQTKVVPVRVGSSHVGHSNPGYTHEHTPLPHTPLPTLPPVFDGPGINEPKVNPDHQFGGTQVNVDSVGTPSKDGDMATSQEIVDSSIKTDWKKPEGAVEMIPTVEESSPMPSTSANTTSESHFGSSQVVVESVTKTHSTEHEHFDKTTIDKTTTTTVGSSQDNQIVSTQITTESVATGKAPVNYENVVIIPVAPIVQEHKTETVVKPAENGQFGSSQTVVDSSIPVELKKTEGIEIIPTIEPSAPSLSKINDAHQSQIVSPQTITSSTVTTTEHSTIGQHSTQMTSTSGTTVYQSTSTQPDISRQINNIVTSIIANENAFGKKTIDPMPSTSTVLVTEVHEIAGPERIVTTERMVSSQDDEISEAFKDFVGGLMSTTPDAQKLQPHFSAESKDGQLMDVTVTSNDRPLSLPMDVQTSTTIEAAKDIISNEMAPSSSTEVIESIPSVVEVVTTQPTSTGYEETKVIATKFTSDGPTFLEVSKTGFHTDTVMTSSTTELHSSQVISKSTFSYQDDQLISTSSTINDSSSEMKQESSVFTTTSSNEQTFSSFTEFSSSSTQHIVSSPDQDTFKSIVSSTSVDDSGPTIVEVSSSTVETPPTSTTYLVSEPSYEYDRSSSPVGDYGGSSYSPAADHADTSFSYDDGGSYDNGGSYGDD